MNFKKFMWLKTLGRFDNIKFGNYGDVHLPAETYINYERNKRIVEDAGVDYLDWKTARRVLNENI